MTPNPRSRFVALSLASIVWAGAAGSAVAADCLLRGVVQFGDGSAPPNVSVAPDGSSIFFFSSRADATSNPLPPGPRAFVAGGQYKCENCFDGTNLAIAFDPNHTRVGEIQVVTCNRASLSARTDLSFNTHATSRLNHAVPADERSGQQGYAYVLSGTVTKQRSANSAEFDPVGDGGDEIDCTSFATTQHGDLVPAATIRSPIVGARYECPVASPIVKLSLASDADRDCYLPALVQIPDQATVPAAVQQDAKFSLEPVGPAQPDCAPSLGILAACTLTGTVRRGGAIPPATETIDCTPAATDNWQPINDATGAYSCATQQGSVTLKLNSGTGGTKMCTCSDTTTVCNVSF